MCCAIMGTRSIQALREDGIEKLYTATAMTTTSASFNSATKAEETDNFAICSGDRLSAGVKFAPTHSWKQPRRFQHQECAFSLFLDLPGRRWEAGSFQHRGA